jgi:hypothetical protein
MLSFAQAVQEADATGLPVVEGIAVQLAAGVGAAAVTAKLAPRIKDYGWTAEDMQDGWLVFRNGDGTAPARPALGTAWEIVRELKKVRGVTKAEPLLLTRLPVTNDSDAQRSFGLWGRVNEDRLKQIREKSGKDFLHWSLEQLGVCDVNGKKGAWTLWKEKHDNKTPGEGVLVAHPDTGYTPHKRLVPRLAVHPGKAGHHGRNFVERDRPDARTNGLDPLEEAFGKFPGHGTGTASVIAAGNGEALEPWGVAPGATILPLRVSSSVIHLSFVNVCDAFLEAIANKADVISMSLGGPVGSELLNTLVLRALDQGIIIVSAAGNNAPTVVFPARIPGVIACAASNALQAPWRFSGMGAEVAITAPGELVWHDASTRKRDGQLDEGRVNGSGTSFATANIAGLAALWLSYHGRQNLIAHCGGQARLLPFLFRLCLQASADAKPKFIRKGEGGFGTGIARADKLLTATLPDVAVVEAERKRILSQTPDSLVGFPGSSWWTIATLPTLTEVEARMPTPAEAASRGQRILALLDQIVGPDCEGEDRSEIGALAATDAGLRNVLQRVGRGGRIISAAAVRRYLLREKMPISDALRQKLMKAREAARLQWSGDHPELSERYVLPTPEQEGAKISYAVAVPPMRKLRAYAFDPSLATRTADAAVNEIIISVVFERDLNPGPVGDYLAVIDVDPASDCAYAPVDLNHPFLLAQHGLPRSEGNPQFHQQMVYAVAMKTIRHFEEALGRPLFWSPLRAWDGRAGEDDRAEIPLKKDKNGNLLLDKKGRPLKDESEQFVQHLRLYPHALREQNAYYSPQKRAILFGYFPAGDGDPGVEYPGGVVFTCLAHDIIAHEMTHAILDGMHIRFAERTNPDVLAFHEAFADIVALFQRFTYSELLRDQIARARGRLDAGTLMTRLALQFGQATGRHQALRDALGYVFEQARQKGEGEWRDREDEGEMDGGGPRRVTLADAARDRKDEEVRYLWKRFQADPSLLAGVEEPHERGSFLVAAVFDAYLRIYENRVADLKRIATGGTGILPDGDLHPDLVSRMAKEASKSARHVLKMCIRAMDYVPPTDITFGEFLRALITADSDLVPDDDCRYRVAFIEAFRKWGIYPRDVRTLSEESLRWSPPRLKASHSITLEEGFFNELRRALFDWQPGQERGEIFEKIKDAQRKIWRYFFELPDSEDKRVLLGGIDTGRTFQVTNLRPARRIGPRGEFLTEMVVEILQRKDALPYDEEEWKKETAQRRRARLERKRRGEPAEPDPIPFRGGVTLIVGMEQNEMRQNQIVVRYAIYKRPDSAAREARQRDFLLRAGGGGSPDAAEYSSDGLPAGWLTREDVRAEWFKGRTSDLEHMRASSCFCRRGKMDDTEEKKKKKAAKKSGIPVPTDLTEPFALLHRS